MVTVFYFKMTKNEWLYRKETRELARWKLDTWWELGEVFNFSVNTYPNETKKDIFLKPIFQSKTRKMSRSSFNWPYPYAVRFQLRVLLFWVVKLLLSFFQSSAHLHCCSNFSHVKQRIMLPRNLKKIKDDKIFWITWILDKDLCNGRRPKKTKIWNKCFLWKI